MLKLHTGTNGVTSISKSRAPRSAACRALAGATAVALSGLLAQNALATTQNSTWTGTGGNNLWSNAANWSPTGAPGNGTNGFSDYNVSIGTPAPCVLTISPIIDNLTMNSGGVLDIQYGSTLQVNGPTLTDNGSIVINSNSGGVLGNIFFGANTAINGSGTISLTQGSYAYMNAAAGTTVTQAAAHTISGYGVLSMGFVNNGTVNANIPGQVLTVANYNASNNLTFEATAGGTLNIGGITVTQGASGQINAATGSLVTLIGTNISAGTLTSAGTGSIQISGTGTIANLTNNAVVNIPYGQALIVVGNLVDNNSIVVNSNQGGVVAALNFSGGTLSGTGNVVLQESSSYSQLDGSLTQSAGHSIIGWGQLNATLNNKGVVNANITGQTMYLESPSIINTNLLEATSGGGLYFDSLVAVNNAGGTINANGGPITLANGASITGGTLTSNGSSVFTLAVVNSSVGYSANLNSVTIAPSTTINIPVGNTLSVTGSVLTDNGTIAVDSTSGGALSNILFGANTSINGSGTILLEQQTYAYLNAATGVTVTQSATHTIAGYGVLTMGFINNGIVNSNFSGQTLTLANFNMSNNLTFEATAGGTLNISAVTATQGVNGQINAATGSLVILGNNTNVSGGTLISAGTGSIQISGADTIASVTNNAKVNIPFGNTLSVIGNLVDNGTVVVNSNQGGVVAALNFSGGTLSGPGTVVLQQPTSNAQLNGSLTQSLGHTITGYGEINATLNNQGVVNASIVGNTLYLEASTLTNSNVLEATAGGILYFDNAIAVNNSGGTINASGGGIVLANGTSITGGTLTSAASSVYTLGVLNSTAGYSARLNNVTITTGTEIDVPYSNTLSIAGSTLTNNGLIVVNSNQGGLVAELLFNSNTLLTGTGTIRLQEPAGNALVATGAGDTVTQDIHHSIVGYGEIAAALINNNIVNANVGAQTLYLDTNPKTNNLTFEATNGGTLYINGITVGQGVNGTIFAANGSAVALAGATVNNGTLSTAGSGYFQVAGDLFSTISGVTSNATINIPYYNGLTVNGNLVDNGTIFVNSNTGGAVAALNFSGGTVSGTGSIVLEQGGNNAQLNGSLTQSPGHTIQGYGQINALVTNNGTINSNVNGQTLTLAAALTNNNILEATTSGAVISVAGINITQGAAGQISAAAGTGITLTNANISGGTIGGAGIYTALGNSALVNLISSSATIDIPYYNQLSVVGNLVDNGTIVVNSNVGGAVAALNFSGGTLSGTGTVVLEQGSNYAQINGSLTQSAGHTIQGYGQINAVITNNGAIVSNVAAQTLTLAAAMTNNSLVAANISGASLYIAGVTVTQGVSGQISLAAGATATLANSNISGGFFNGPGVATVSGISTLNNVTNSALIDVPYYNELNINGNLVDNGSIVVNNNTGGAVAAFNVSGGTVSGNGSIILEQGNNYAQINGSLTQAAGHSILGYGQVNATLINNGTVNANVTGQTLTLNGTTTGTGNFQASAGGTLYVTGSLTITAPGSLIGAGAASPIVVSGGASLIDNGSIAGLPAITDNGILTIAANPNTGILTRSLTSLSLGTTGLATVVNATNLSNRTLLITSALNFTGNPGAWTGKLNLGNNDMDVSAGSLSNITSQISEGYNGGKWNGAGGIVSSAAAANPTLLTTLGSIQNNQSGVAIYTASNKFDGTTPGVADILVKYTYYGDTNLDGKVDGSDYSRIDAAFTLDKTNPAAATGWFNGDFNYDGVINGSDYTLLDNTFNTQGAAITAQIADPSASIAAQVAPVPEPVSLGILSLPAAFLLGRRRRKSR